MGEYVSRVDSVHPTKRAAATDKWLAGTAVVASLASIYLWVNRSPVVTACPTSFNVADRFETKSFTVKVFNPTLDRYTILGQLTDCSSIPAPIELPPLSFAEVPLTASIAGDLDHDGKIRIPLTIGSSHGESMLSVTIDPAPRMKP